MQASKVLPTAMIVLSVGAALVYLSQGDIRRTVYWTAAAALTASVTF